MIPLLIYIAIFAAAYWIFSSLLKTAGARGFTALKTVTFGDESAVRPNRFASVISIATILLLWGMFTGSKLLPEALHAPVRSRARSHSTTRLRTAPKRLMTPR